MLTEERCDLLRSIVETRSCQRVAQRFKEPLAKPAVVSQGSGWGNKRQVEASNLREKHLGEIWGFSLDNFGYAVNCELSFTTLTEDSTAPLTDANEHWRRELDDWRALLAPFSWKNSRAPVMSPLPSQKFGSGAGEVTTRYCNNTATFDIR